MNKPIIEVIGLSKNYGNKRALNDINLKLYGHNVLGVLGPNGSGKTTLIKILAGLINKTSGQVLIDGKSPGPLTKKIVSYLPDRNFINEVFTIEQSIKLFADFFEDFNLKKAYEMLDFMDLDKNQTISELSKGMKEKLNLSLILSRDALVYIIDEPIAGVDPVVRDKILDALLKNVNENSTMLITTHLIRDMEALFDDVVFLDKGDIILSANCENLRQEKNMSIDSVYKELYEWR